MAQENLVKEFISVTGSDEARARQMLEAYANNLEFAVSAYLDDGFPKADSGCLGDNRENGEVRAPIPQTRGVLVDDYGPSPHWMSRNRPRSVFDGFRNFKAEEDGRDASGDKKLKRLEDLFRPPLDMMHKGTFETAKAAGEVSKKWLLVNVQNVREFVCQVLNRDVWSNPSVKSLINENFIFWQVYSDSSEGERFMSFYNVSSWPHISILDPRTGGLFATITKYNKEEVMEELTSFLEQHGSLGSDCEPPSKKAKRDILDSSEDSQMAAAIAASLQESRSAKPIESCSNSRSSDSFDSLSEIESDTEKSANNEVTKTNGAPARNNNSSGGESPRRKKLVKIFPKKKTPALDPFKRDRERFSTTDENLTAEAQNSADGRTVCSNLPNASERCRNGFPKSQTTNSTSSGTCCIMLRFPNGGKDKVILREDNTIGDLLGVVATKGYDSKDYELLTNYPRRLVSNRDPSTTLLAAGLCPQEAVFVQEKL